MQGPSTGMLQMTGPKRGRRSPGCCRKPHGFGSGKPHPMKGRRRTRHRKRGCKKRAPGLKSRVLQVSIIIGSGEGCAERLLRRAHTRSGMLARATTLHGEMLAHHSVSDSLEMRDMSIRAEHGAYFNITGAHANGRAGKFNNAVNGGAEGAERSRTRQLIGGPAVQRPADSPASIPYRIRFHKQEKSRPRQTDHRDKHARRHPSRFDDERHDR